VQHQISCPSSHTASA